MKLRRGFWIALVLFLGLLAYVRYYESRRPVDTGPVVVPFLAVESTRLSGITVAFSRDTTRMEPVDGSWRIISPVDFPADPIAVEALLSRCRSLEILRRFRMDPGQLQSYGLVHPGAWLRFDLRDGTSRTLTIGSVAAASPAYYIRIDESDTLGLLRDGEVDNFFRKETDGWRDPSLMNFSPGAAVSFVLSSGGHRVRVDRGPGAAGWRITDPFDGPGDTAFITDFLKGLAATKARSYPEDHPGALRPFGLDPPEGSVTVVDSAGGQHRLLLGATFDGLTGAERFAARSGREAIYGVPAAYIALSRRSDLDFRQKYLYPSGLRGVREILLSAGADTARFLPDAAGTWRLAGEVATPGAPPPDRGEFVRTLIQAAADSIVAAGGRLRSSPVLVVEMRADTTASRLEILDARSGPGDREFWPARFIFPDHNRPGEVFLLGPDLVRPLLALLKG